MEKISIPYLPYVSYNQIQAEELGLNHTEAILMNYFAYFLPNFGIVKTRNDKNYYWLNYNKMFSDMPTLDFCESTLRRHINKLIKNGLLERILITEIKNKTRAFYRAKKTFLGKTKKCPFNFTTLYNNIEELLKDGKVDSIEKDKLNHLLSSYKGSKKQNKTSYNLEGVGGTPILDYLVEEFKLSEKGEGVEINVGVEIDYDYIETNIVNQILDIGKDYGWIKMKTSGAGLDVNDDVKGKILGKLKTMFNWHKEKNKPIKSFKGKLNTFFGKAWL